MLNKINIIVVIGTLLLAWECKTSAAECPSQCVCKELSVTDCSRKRLEMLPDGIDIEVRSLDLSHNDFTTVPSNISSFTGLESLNLRHNRINAMSAHSLDGLHQLRDLDLSENHFRRYSDLHTKFLSPATSLLQLDLSHNQLKSFPELKSATLERLDLTNCSISAFQPGILINVPNLKTLNVGENLFQTLRHSLEAPKLKSLNLTACAIQSISILTLDKTPDLSHLFLAANNGLKTFQLNSSSLQYLHLSECNLEGVPRGAMPNLTLIDLEGNHIRKLEALAFKDMPNIRKIYMQRNSISVVDKLAFAYAQQLELVDISQNTIRDLDDQVFIKNKNLETVRLSRNYIEEVIPFQSTSITDLDLRHCEITTCSWNSLIRMSKLKDLNLSGNPLHGLPINLTSSSLQRLHVANCRLTALKNSTFSQVPRIHFLDIVGNRLVEFQFRDFHTIRNIRMSDNPWRCDCDKKSFQYLHDVLINIDSDVMYARCQTPEHLEGKTWEDACGDLWYGYNLYRGDRAWLVSLCLMLIFVITCGLFIIINRKRHKTRARQMRLERTLEAQERLTNLITASTRHLNEEAAQNAPDPRELQRPPSYHEAIQMPPLGSTTSIASRKSDAIGIDTDNNNGGVKQKARRKRRRKSPGPGRASQTSDFSSVTDNQDVTQSNPNLQTINDENESKRPESARSRRRRRRSATRSRELGDSSDTSFVETDM